MFGCVFHSKSYKYSIIRFTGLFLTNAHNASPIKATAAKNTNSLLSGIVCITLITSSFGISIPNLANTKAIADMKKAYTEMPIITSDIYQSANLFLLKGNAIKSGKSIPDTPMITIPTLDIE